MSEENVVNKERAHELANLVRKTYEYCLTKDLPNKVTFGGHEFKIGISVWIEHENVRHVEWISVKKNLPKESGKYLVCTKKGNVYQTKFYTYPENKGGHWGQKDKGRSITHWMPLPEAPKGGESNV